MQLLDYFSQAFRLGHNLSDSPWVSQPRPTLADFVVRRLYVSNRRALDTALRSSACSPTSRCEWWQHSNFRMWFCATSPCTGMRLRILNVRVTSIMRDIVQWHDINADTSRYNSGVISVILSLIACTRSLLRVENAHDAQITAN